MRPTVPTLLLLVGLTTSVAAEDFSGFYAGVNAGYIAERSERSGAISVPPGTFDAESGLPPSALDAADRMTGRDGPARARAPQR